MLYFVLGIHVLVCIALIIAILLHNPQGAGLTSELAGGISYQGRTLLERYLDSVTIGLGVVFAITTFILLVLFSV